MAISAFALSLLPSALGPATTAAAAPLTGSASDAASDVRAAGFPDLTPVEIKVLNVPGSSQRLLCVAIQNVGTGNAGPFDVEFKIDGVVPPGGIASAGKLDAGKSGELCIQTTLPASGLHMLSAVVDSTNAVAESNETNNTKSVRVFLGTLVHDLTAPKPSAGISPAP
ncbi:MAG: CARDB domain-containing protein [Chloroflexota bacterium]